MRARLLSLFVAAVLVAPLSVAHAAPQALGLMATNAAVPLPCLAGECAAEFSAFCLQQTRGVPDPGARYRVLGEDFTLLAIAADGKTRRLSGADHLTIVSARSFSAVRISLSKQMLAALGAVRAAVEVGPRVSLVPVAVAGDPDPQSDEEVATASGPLRKLGEAIVDNAGAEADAARLTNALINDLPEAGRVGVARAERLWRERLAQSTAGAEAVTQATGIYETCRARVAAGHYFSLRRCLEVKHDERMLNLNRRYWQAIVGS